MAGSLAAHVLICHVLGPVVVLLEHDSGALHRGLYKRRFLLLPLPQDGAQDFAISRVQLCVVLERLFIKGVDCAFDEFVVLLPAVQPLRRETQRCDLVLHEDCGAEGDGSEDVVWRADNGGGVIVTWEALV